jgi:hypothetical protein
VHSFHTTITHHQYGAGKLTTFGDGDYLLSWDDERTKAQHALCLIDVQKGSKLYVARLA